MAKFGPKPKPVGERFAAKVRVSKGCWTWTGATNGTYGWFRMNDPRRGEYAHRVAWFLAHGELPTPSQVVGHHCDNPLCVRPEHLFLGTVADNVADKIRKGRGRGRFSPPESQRMQWLGHKQKRTATRARPWHSSEINSTLTAADVLGILRRRVAGGRVRQIATDFGVSEGTIYRILSGLRWRSLTGVHAADS